MLFGCPLCTWRNYNHMSYVFEQAKTVSLWEGEGGNKEGVGVHYKNRNKVRGTEA